MEQTEIRPYQLTFWYPASRSSDYYRRGTSTEQRLYCSVMRSRHRLGIHVPAATDTRNFARTGGRTSKHANLFGKDRNVFIDPDGDRNQELCWRGPAANYCSDQGVDSSTRIQKMRNPCPLPHAVHFHIVVIRRASE
jgi:hypothetical protein